MTSTCLRLARLSAAVLSLLLILPPAFAAEPLATTEVAPGVFVHQGLHEETSAGNHGDIANLGFVVGAESVAVIDSGGSARQGAALLAALREITDLPVRYLILTHMHPDHVLGSAAFAGEDPTVVGHAKLPRALESRGAFYLERLQESLGEAAEGTGVPDPELLVDDEALLDLGGRKLSLRAWPTAHTDNDLTVLDEQSGTLFLGDLLFVERVPALDGSLKGWISVMDELAEVPAARAVPGHGPPSVDWPSALADQRRYLDALLTDIRALIAEGDSIEDAVAKVALEERDKWLLFDSYHPRNIVTGFTELEWE